MKDSGFTQEESGESEAAMPHSLTGPFILPPFSSHHGRCQPRERAPMGRGTRWENERWAKDVGYLAVSMA